MSRAWVVLTLTVLVGMAIMGGDAAAVQECPPADVTITAKQVGDSPTYEITVTDNDINPIGCITIYNKDSLDSIAVEQVLSPLWWRGKYRISDNQAYVSWEAYTSAKYIKPNETISGFKVILKTPSETIRNMSFTVYGNPFGYEPFCRSGMVTFEE